MKSEIKVEFENSKNLIHFFERSYEGGRIKNICQPLEVQDSDGTFDSLKSINNGIIRVTNKDVIDGFCRFIISSDGDKIELSPISINYILIDGRWMFF